MINKALFTSNKEDWETPQDLFDKLNDEFHFTIDVCASSENAKCEKYFTKEQNGLSQKWEGTIWCNPPYGKHIGLWTRKALFNSQLVGSTVVMLLPARTDTGWFHAYVYGKAEIRFLKGRLKFGNSKNSAPFPSMLVIYRGKENNDTHN